MEFYWLWSFIRYYIFAIINILRSKTPFDCDRKMKIFLYGFSHSPQLQNHDAEALKILRWLTEIGLVLDLARICPGGENSDASH